MAARSSLNGFSLRLFKEFLVYNFVLTFLSVLMMAICIWRSSLLWALIYGLSMVYFSMNIGYAATSWERFQRKGTKHRVYLRRQGTFGIFPKWVCGNSSDILTLDGNLVSKDAQNSKTFYAWGIFAKHRAFLFAMRFGYLALI